MRFSRKLRRQCSGGGSMSCRVLLSRREPTASVHSTKTVSRGLLSLLPDEETRNPSRGALRLQHLRGKEIGICDVRRSRVTVSSRWCWCEVARYSTFGGSVRAWKQPSLPRDRFHELERKPRHSCRSLHLATRHTVEDLVKLRPGQALTRPRDKTGAARKRHGS